MQIHSLALRRGVLTALGVLTTTATAAAMTVPASAAPAGVDHDSWHAVQKTLAAQRAKASETKKGALTRAQSATLTKGLATSGQRDSAGVGPGPDTSYDGNLTVDVVTTAGRTSRSIAPTAGAALGAASPWGGSNAQWGPAGDRVLFQNSTAGDHAANADGSHVVDYQSLGTPAQRQWSPFGDAAVGSSATGTTIQTATPGLRQQVPFDLGVVDGSPTVGSYGDVAIMAYHPTGAPTTSDLGYQLLDGKTNVQVDQPMTQPAESLGLSAYSPREPHLALRPGVSIMDDTNEYLAFAGLVPGTSDARLFVDHDDSQTEYLPVAVADLGALCSGNQMTFSPSHSQIAYIKAVGPAGDECSQSELHVLKASGARYDTGATDIVVTTLPAGSHFENPTWKAQTPAAASFRIDGRDRVEVAINASTTMFAGDDANVVVLSGAKAFADALAGSPLAAQVGGPVLFTNGTTLDQRTRTEIDRVLLPGGTIYITGGTATVSSGIETTLKNAGYDVRRLGGRNRYEVAVYVAKALVTEMGPRANIFVADGNNWPDALVSGPAASLMNGAVLLTSGTAMPATTKSYLDSLGFTAKPNTAAYQGGVYAVGGAARTATASRADTDRDALFGVNRYQVAQKVADTFFGAESTVGLADGRNWPDAVSGGATMALMGQPILLSSGSTVPAYTQARIAQSRSAADFVLAFGGTASVPDSAITTAVALAGNQTVIWGPDTP